MYAYTRNWRKTCRTQFGRLCRKPGCLFTALAECFLKRGCLLNHQFQPDASFAPMAIFKPPRLGLDFSNQHRRNPVLFLAAANPVSHANVLSGCKDFTHNHANTFPPLKIFQTISESFKICHFMRIIDYFKWDCECSVSMLLMQTDIDCGTHLCTGWCFCPGLPLLTLFFHTCKGQREQQGQLKWKIVRSSTFQCITWNMGKTQFWTFCSTSSV